MRDSTLRRARHKIPSFLSSLHRGRPKHAPYRTYNSMKSGETFEHSWPDYQARVNVMLDRLLPSAAMTPRRLHGAMREAVLRGGKRLRPLVCYAAAEATGVTDSLVDAPALAIELIHCYSLVHDDMPCMDDDELRRGKPSIHKMYGEDAALLVGDALQTLAWQVLATHPSLKGHDGARVRLIELLAECAGSSGMAGGQDLDLNGGEQPDLAELEHAYRTKTGALFRAAALAPACIRPDLPLDLRNSLEAFADALGLAFQIRDDLADRDSDRRQHQQGGGAGLPSWVQRFGAGAARERVSELTEIMHSAQAEFGDRGGGLRWLMGFIRGTQSASAAAATMKQGKGEQRGGS